MTGLGQHDVTVHQQPGCGLGFRQLPRCRLWSFCRRLDGSATGLTWRGFGYRRCDVTPLRHLLSGQRRLDIHFWPARNRFRGWQVSWEFARFGHLSGNGEVPAWQGSGGGGLELRICALAFRPGLGDGRNARRGLPRGWHGGASEVCGQYGMRRRVRSLE